MRLVLRQTHKRVNTVITLSQLEKNVEGWSRKRGILEQSTYEKQIEKFFSERAELFTTDNPKDAYGDQMVCLINAYLLRSTASVNAGVGIDTGVAVTQSEIENRLMIGDIRSAIVILDDEISISFNPKECYQIAWDEIKKRAGLMVDGIYVKWADLTHLQRLEAAKKGQLLEPDIDLDFCQSCCTSYEWSEIRAAEQAELDS